MTGRAPRWSSSLKALGLRSTAPPIVAGTGRISKMLIVGTWPAGANLVKASAEVKPAIPPPKIMILSPLLLLGEAAEKGMASYVRRKEGCWWWFEREEGRSKLLGAWQKV